MTRAAIETVAQAAAQLPDEGQTTERTVVAIEASGQALAEAERAMNAGSDARR